MGIPNVQAYIDIHAYSQMWMYPWGYTQLPPNQADKTLLVSVLFPKYAWIISFTTYHCVYGYYELCQNTLYYHMLP